ncbi:AMP-binding protein, partial [Amycolatopsis rhizosphaerae]
MEGYRLSPQQKRAWLIRRADPHGHYFARATAEIAGVPEESRLRAALDGVGHRHELLRTVFHRPSGVDIPLQVIGAEPLTTVTFHDARTGGAKPVEDRIPAAFDLERGPLLHADLVVLSDTSSRLVVTLPAAYADTASLHHLLAEIWRAYRNASGPAEDVLQYADAAEWQNDLLTARETAAGRAFWQDAPAMRPGALLPCERGGPGTPVFRPASIAVPADPVVLAAARKLAAASGVRLSAVFLTAWHVLFSRLAGEPAVLALLGENRPHEQMREAVGPFALPLPCLFPFDEDLPFGAAVARVHERAREMLRRQEFFDVSAAGDAPSARVTFSWDETGPLTPDGSWSLTRAVSHGEPFTVRLAGSVTGDAVALRVHHNTSRLPGEDAHRLAGMYATLLAAATRAPATPLAALPVASPTETRRVLAAAAPARETSEPGQVLALFQEQAALHPEWTAVVAGAHRLSYLVLNERANRLAHHLRGLGVTTETPVGLPAERSAEVLVSLLGILKAGGAAVPFDPATPPERLAFLLAETRTRLVLTGRTDNLPTDVATLDPGSPALAGEPGENLDGPHPEQLAYVIFTSGSTGRPKAVGVTHAALAAYTRGIGDVLALPPRASYATASTLATDLGNTAVYPALCTGGTVHLLPADYGSGPAPLPGFDCLKIVPTHLRALLGTPHAAGLLPRSRLVLGGEAPGWDLVDAVRELAPQCRIFNHYGPTETTVGVLARELTPD